MGTEFWNGAEAAHRRVMMKAAGYSDKDIRRKPHIGVPNSYMAGSPGSAHLRQIAEAVKEGIWAAGGVPVEFGIPATCGNIAQADIRPKGRKGIHNQYASHAQDGQAHAAAAQLHHDQNADHREGKQHGVGADNGVVGQSDLLRVKGEVEKGDAPHNHDDDVVPGQAVHLDMALPDGEIQISDDDNPAQESAQAKFGLVSVNQGQIYTEQGKSNCDELYNPLGSPLPHTDVGLPVKLFHDLVHVSRAPNLLGIRRGSADGRRNFLLFFPKTHVPVR